MPEVLLTINANQQMHWRVRGRHARSQRYDAMMAAFAALAAFSGTLRHPLFREGRVKADVQVFRRPRQQVPDAGAQWEILKPAFDGFEDAGVVTNDKQIVHGAIIWHPTDAEPRIEVTLTEVTP